MAVVGQIVEQADVKHHVFFCMWLVVNINPSDFRCLSEQIELEDSKEKLTKPY